jgi:hypothetical protein
VASALGSHASSSASTTDQPEIDEGITIEVLAAVYRAAAIHSDEGATWCPALALASIKDDGGYVQVDPHHHVALCTTVKVSLQERSARKVTEPSGQRLGSFRGRSGVFTVPGAALRDSTAGASGVLLIERSGPNLKECVPSGGARERCRANKIGGPVDAERSDSCRD